ncbi:MAG: YHS domain-containing protein [Planctomycetes bacterium]|nr:YHS domain-containing protein [Planctomycetota bacterium]
MKSSKPVSKDPICGMTVDPATAIHAERNGKTYYFCGETCLKKFIDPQSQKESRKDAKGCCG